MAITPAAKLTPGLIARLKANKQEILNALKRTSTPDQYQNKHQARIIDSGPSHESRRYCEGYRPPRPVHPDVCRWHLDEADPICMHCKHLSGSDKEVWMDAFLNKAIERLNRYCRYGGWVDRHRQEARELIEKLEKKITEAFLGHDIDSFKDAVDKWEQTFKK